MVTEFKVAGMHCISCKNLIEEDLGEMPGVRAISVDLPGGRARVDFNEQQITINQLIEKIAELGYQAESIA
jgi:copper chaperone CopZ